MRLLNKDAIVSFSDPYAVRQDRRRGSVCPEERICPICLMCSRSGIKDLLKGKGRVGNDPEERFLVQFFEVLHGKNVFPGGAFCPFFEKCPGFFFKITVNLAYVIKKIADFISEEGIESFEKGGGLSSLK